MIGIGGTSLQLGLLRSDPVGRFGMLLVGAAGDPALPQGGALTITSNASRTVLSGSAWISHEGPSRIFAPALAEGLDLSRIGGALRAERVHVGDGWELAGAVGALGESRSVTMLGQSSRRAALALVSGAARQRSDEARFEERLALMGEAGSVDSASYLRHRGMLVFATGSGGQPLATFRLSFGNVSGRGAPLERFVLGGLPTALMDSVYDVRRVGLPAYPIASLSGTSFTAYRIGLPVSVVELFYSSATTDLFRRQLRGYGGEFRQSVPAVAALGTPDVDLVTGVVRAVDEPMKGDWQFYLTVRLRP